MVLQSGSRRQTDSNYLQISIMSPEEIKVKEPEQIFLFLNDLKKTIKDNPRLKLALNALTKPLPGTELLDKVIAKLPEYHPGCGVATAEKGIRELQSFMFFPKDQKERIEAKIYYQTTLMRVLLCFAYVRNADKALAVIKIGGREVTLDQIDSLLDIANRIALNETNRLLTMIKYNRDFDCYTYTLRCPAYTPPINDGCRHSVPIPPPYQKWDVMGSFALSEPDW